ncbi:MAG TPA: glucosamine-6-phosphate deaminase [Chloroflexota bacterium]|nr:glucosamine-6-phosphate deaminase [Chloroflexota bacterium]
MRRPRIVVTAGYEAMSLAGAEIVDATIRSLPGAVLALPTGGTPVGMYACLATMYRERGTDWSGVTTFNLDEYCDTGPNDPQSYAAYMEHHLFAHIRIPSPQRHLPDGLAPDPEAEARRYEGEIDARGGIDLAVLGVGTNGHIGFNEPGPGLVAETHVALLADETWGRNFPDLARRAQREPALRRRYRRAYTMGMGTILQARRILLLASGEEKRQALREPLEGPLTTANPASLLRLHPRVTLVLDEAALGDPVGGP